MLIKSKLNCIGHWNLSLRVSSMQDMITIFLEYKFKLNEPWAY